MIAAPRPNPVAHFSLLAGLSPHELASFLSELRKVRVVAGQIVIIQNDLTNQVFFSGRLHGQLTSENGRGISFTQISAGNYFGELAALDDSPRSITVSAIEKSQLGVMSGRVFRRWLTRRVPALPLALVSDLAVRNRQLTERIHGLVAHDVDKRVRSYLARLALNSGAFNVGGVLERSPSNEEIVTFVGANREAVSRVISRLACEGILESGRRRIIIRNVDAMLAGI